MTLPQCCNNIWITCQCFRMSNRKPTSLSLDNQEDISLHFQSCQAHHVRKILMITPNRVHLFKTSHVLIHSKIVLRSKFNLTCGYPPCATALTSVSFSSAIIDSFNTGGVRKSECRTSLLDDARLAYNKHKTCTNYKQRKHNSGNSKMN